MIRKLLLSSVALAAITGTAFAADLPSRRAPPLYAPPIPTFTWTGLYIGGQVGYAFGSESTSFVNPGFSSVGAKPNGIIGGGHVGYNFSTQGLPVFGGVFGTGGVIGLEGDIDGSDYRSTTAALPGVFPTSSLKSPLQASIRGRIGIAVDRALFYATGGAAFADFKTGYVDSSLGVPNADTGLTRSRVGYTVGGGVEYAITNNWSLRAEYRYSDFGTFSDATNNLAPEVATIRHRETIQRAQVGFSYKFDSPVLAPVVAKY